MLFIGNLKVLVYLGNVHYFVMNNILCFLEIMQYHVLAMLAYPIL